MMAEEAADVAEAEHDYDSPRSTLYHAVMLALYGVPLSCWPNNWPHLSTPW